MLSESDGEAVSVNSQDAEKPKKREKSPKPPKGEKKKKKDWKSGNSGKISGEEGSQKSQQPPNPEGAENGQLKINVNPTEIAQPNENEQNAEGPTEEQKADDGKPKEETKKEGLTVEVPPTDAQRSQQAGSKLSNKSKEEAASPMLPKSPAPKPEKQMSKRQMDHMFLTKEAREIKEKLLDYTNQIVVRQNGMDPIANFENFVVETSSRRVLKELLQEFEKTSEELRKKQQKNTDVLTSHETRIASHGAQMKKLQEQCRTVDTFQKRMQIVEQRLDTSKDQAEKRHESLKDFVSRTKDMLEARVDQITQFNVKIQDMQSSLDFQKSQNQEFMERIMQEVVDSKKRTVSVENDLKEFKDQTQEFFKRSESWNEEKSAALKLVSREFGQLEVYVRTEVDKIAFAVERKAKIEDMRQNFQRLNDILLVKFKQVEDTKQACRNLITFQKYFQPIQTQQIISENLMHLKVAQKDDHFVHFQKNFYNQITDETRERLKLARGNMDQDLNDHLLDLDKKNIKQGDWDVYPMPDISEGCDFVTDLLYSYFEDLRVRKKVQEYGSPPTSVLLRKGVRLGDIDLLIDNLSKTTVDLVSATEQYAAELAEEKRLKEMRENIRRLQHRKLEYKNRDAKKRKHSFKGRVMDPLIAQGDEMEEFTYKMDNEPRRPKSRPAAVRKDKLRPVQQEHKITYEEGAIQSINIRDSQASLPSIASDMSQLNHDGHRGGGAAHGGQGSAIVAGGGQVGPPQEMTFQQKQSLFNEMKEDFRPLIIKIADDQAEKIVKILRIRTQKYEEENEQEKIDIVAKMEGELLRVSEFLKKSMTKISADFQEELGSFKKQRARDKSDYDGKLQKNANLIQDTRIDLNRHQTYFDALAQSISLLIENINMQMEAENADLFDRKLMALYGAKPGKASLIDVNTKMDSKVRTKLPTSPSVQNLDQDELSSMIDAPTQSRKTLGFKQSEESQRNLHSKMAESALEASKSGEATAESARGIDDIRYTSGKPVPRNEMSITVDHQCISHQQTTNDTHLTMKLFKIACLAYKPGEINYRDQNVPRTQMIEMRRQLIDRVQAILPTCDLFKTNAYYPKRYYDDLMIDDKGYEQYINDAQTHFDYETLKKSKLNVLLGIQNANSSTDVGSGTNRNVFQSSSRNLAHSPTQQHALNSSNFTLPDLGNKLAQKLQFGIGQKTNYESISDVQQLAHTRNRNQSMTIDIDDANEVQTRAYANLSKLQLKGINTVRNRNNHTDIKRNASVAVVNNMTQKLFNSSRKGFKPAFADGNAISTESRAGLALQQTAPGVFSPLNGPVTGFADQTHQNYGKTLDFHRRNQSTIGNATGLKMEIGGHGFGKHKPSVGLPMRPKVSFDLPGIQR